MGVPSQDILDRIPQREPFLFVDEIIRHGEKFIETRFTLTGEEGFLKGHFPGNPIMPGVLLQEVCFQSGALYLSYEQEDRLAVISRVNQVKFRAFVRPGDCLEIYVEIENKLKEANYMKGKIKVGNKTVMSAEFVGLRLDS